MSSGAWLILAAGLLTAAGIAWSLTKSDSPAATDTERAHQETWGPSPASATALTPSEPSMAESAEATGVDPQSVWTGEPRGSEHSMEDHLSRPAELPAQEDDPLQAPLARSRPREDRPSTVKSSIREALVQSWQARFPNRPLSSEDADDMTEALLRLRQARLGLRSLPHSSVGAEARRQAYTQAIAEAAADFEQIGGEPMDSVTGGDSADEGLTPPDDARPAVHELLPPAPVRTLDPDTERELSDDR